MATVRFNLKIRKDGKAAVIMRFTIDRNNRFKLSTGETIDPKFWDARLQQAKTKYPDHLYFNQAIGKIKADVIQLYRDNKDKPLPDLQEMARAVIHFGQSATPEKKTVFTIYAQFLEQYAKEKDVKTVKKYETLYHERRDGDKVLKAGKLWEFNPRLSIDKLDNNFCDAFKDFLYKKGLLDSTVYKYITNLSTFLTWADKRGHQVHRTNGRLTHLSWEIIKRRNEPLTLTLAELEKLETLQINEAVISEKLPPQKHGRRGERTVKALTTARDIFILECRTCQRISDLKKFNLKDVIDEVWHNPVTKGRRLNAKKTRIPFNTKFTAPAWAILQKYKFQLPEFTEQKVNENIKTVCMLAGIDSEIIVGQWKRNQYIETRGPKYEFISTHKARATFITLALQFMQPKLVKDIAGVSWNTLKHYEGESEDHNLIEGLNNIPSGTLMKTA